MLKEGKLVPLQLASSGVGTVGLLLLGMSNFGLM